MMQLQKTGISCSVHNKETKEHLEMYFNFLSTILFSSKDKSISECVVQVHDAIVASLNRNHAIWLNYNRLRTLDTIGMVFYKRLSSISQTPIELTLHAPPLNLKRITKTFVASGSAV
jgi:hypothetical protein